MAAIELFRTALINDPNLKAYYRLENANATVAGINLTDHGTVAYNPGEFNNAADFGASNSTKYLDATNNLGIDGGSCTIVAWVNITTSPGTDVLENLIVLNGSSSDTGLTMRYRNISGTIKMEWTRNREGVAEDSVFETITLTTGTWYHMALTYNGTTLIAYRNGVTTGNISSSGNGSGSLSDAFAIGSNFGSRFLNGLIDDVAVFDRVLTPTEISNLYTGAGGSPSLSPSASLSPSSSLSPSASLSPSPSLSPSSSNSASSSASQSPSGSASASISPSASQSPSLSPSASPSPGYTDYSREGNASLPSNNNDLSTNYTVQEVIDISTKDGVYVGQVGLLVYMIHQFKNFAGSHSVARLEWQGQSSLAPSASTVYLQIYNQNTATWDTIGSNNSTNIDTDFILLANVENITNYKDAHNLISCRVYQLAI